MTTELLDNVTSARMTFTPTDSNYTAVFAVNQQPIAVSRIVTPQNDQIDIDFRSPNNLFTYGPKFWHVIHTFAIMYKPEKHHSYLTFILSLRELIPCPRCRRHFKEHLPKIEILDYLGSKDSIFMWTYLIHDEVNVSRQVVSLPYQHILKVYSQSEMQSIDLLLPKMFYMLFTFCANYIPARKSYLMALVVVMCNLIYVPQVQKAYKDALSKYSFDKIVVDQGRLDILRVDALEWCYGVYNATYTALGKSTLDWDRVRNYFIMETV